MIKFNITINHRILFVFIFLVSLSIIAQPIELMNPDNDFKNTPLDVPYQVKCISGERPQVLCNSKINFKEKLSSSAYLQSIVMPSIFREVLIKYMFDEELEDEDWLENVFKFISENLTDEKYPDRVNGSFVKKSETLDWIEMVTDRFASKQKFVDSRCY